MLYASSCRSQLLTPSLGDLIKGRWPTDFLHKSAVQVEGAFRAPEQQTSLLREAASDPSQDVLLSIDVEIDQNVAAKHQVQDSPDIRSENLGGARRIIDHLCVKDDLDVPMLPVLSDLPQRVIETV